MKDDTSLELTRKYGYDILINRFEPFLRKFIINELIVPNFGIKDWQKLIPKGVIEKANEDKDIDISTIKIEDFFEEIYLWGLKEIAIHSNHYQFMQNLVGNLPQHKFIEMVDELHDIRRKIAHAKSSFTALDLERLIENVKMLCQEKKDCEILNYIKGEKYKDSGEIPLNFFEEYRCPNNLPVEDYDLDGGFVGRRKEIDTIKKLLYSEQDRVITVTGAGGLGKTAVTLKTAYNILADETNPFEAIIWFSAKETKLTPEEGIVKIKPGISNCAQLIKDIMQIVDFKTFDVFEKSHIPFEKYQESINGIFSSQKCLLIIDNLETIKDAETVEFIKNIPRPSQVLITSRKGLGEIERRYPLPDFSDKDAKILFRLISKERNRTDLLKLPDTTIESLVKKVKDYPLLIKWSIGKVCLGKEIKEAFSEIYSGQSEIAEFVFNDIFEILSDESKKCLYSMIILGDRPVSKHILIHLAGLDEEKFDDAIRELTLAAFVYTSVTNGDGEITTSYHMLSLTRGFISHKLDTDEKTRNILQTRHYELSQQIEQLEKSQKAYDQSLFSLGIKTEEQKIAFNHVKTAKNFVKTEMIEKARENFEQAIKIAPNFSYALIEYAKFEFWTGHIENSNKLFTKTVSADQDNFHAFFSFGICLRKQNKIKESIKMLETAQKLNPHHLPIYNELGRAYTFDGEYEKAEEQFDKASKETKYPNYKHKFITLQFRANNSHRWSQSFLKRQDYENAIKQLTLALSRIEEANKIKRGDRASIIWERNICKDYAVAHCIIGNFDEAAPFFERCLQPITLMNGITIKASQEMAEACYYYAYYGKKFSKLSNEKLGVLIRKGMAINIDAKFAKRFSDLKSSLENVQDITDENIKHGTIDWYNEQKYFGVISSGEEKYLFFLNNIRKQLSYDEIMCMQGKNVSFTLIDNLRKKDSKIATDIDFKDEYI